MIHIFYVPGMFGSTIEYSLRSYTNEYESIPGEILSDGSMHSFVKEFHPKSLEAVDHYKNYHPKLITTMGYPKPTHHLPEILKSFEHLSHASSMILIYADSLRSAELNMLFQYYKIVTGSYNQGMGIFCGNNEKNIVRWNPSYTHWSDMQTWELREWLSLFYPVFVQEWIESVDQASDNFLKIKNTEILFDTQTAMKKIIKFCQLTPKHSIDSFLVEWQTKQQYIVDEFVLLDQIMDNTVGQIEFEWKPISIIGESIVQQRLREIGYEIRCDGLNTFPTSSKDLYKLLEKC